MMQIKKLSITLWVVGAMLLSAACTAMPAAPSAPAAAAPAAEATAPAEG